MDWIAALFEIIGLWLVGNKRKIGFLSCAACSLIWIYVGLKRPMYGLSVAAAACLIAHIRNYLKWRGDQLSDD